MPWTTPPGSGATVHIWNGYSLAERDRRWQAVRGGAAKAGFDCILVPLGNGIDGRYMTQLRCSAMALPTDGRAPIITADRRSSNDWVPDPWQTGREWAEPMAEALLDLGMQKARVGVAGLKGGSLSHCSASDGVVNYSALAYVMERLPQARFEDATDIIGRVRFVKSAEELQCVRHSAEVATVGLETLIKLARPGLDAGVLYSEVLAAMLERRSEYFPLTISIEAIENEKPRIYTNPPIGRRLDKNALITNEINAIIGAQLTQVCQPILLGSVPASWQALIRAQSEIYQEGLSRMKPGMTFGALADWVTSAGDQRGIRAVMQVHGCGYGDDGPLFTRRQAGARDVALVPNSAFVWKPAVISADGGRQYRFGGPLVINASGAESLFNRESSMISIA